MIRTLIWFIYFWFYLFLSLPDLIRIKYLARKGQETKLNTILFNKVGKWARSLVRLAGGKVAVTGGENVPSSGPVLFVSNHQGNFDIPILLGFITKPKAFIAKMETKKLPLVSSWMTFMKCIFIKRDNLRQSLKAIQQGAKALTSGQSLVIFPEGTRSKSSQLGAFKPGSFKLALEAQVPIIPVTINGSYKLMERQGIIIQPAKVEVVIAAPVFPPEKITAQELASQIREIIKTNLKETPA
ncbi:MAG TPA: 1-acyl-sn-glycerol-3-phosphate acyltransferase [Firmicutes bacterium]|jgi:1-acyl-sn-glycerol-3-phosphate acyltransferase|nr:1-acyl-sn-glycerol-3-phosphate acyltransferase [Bacillota bacterium]HBT18179.1 1-acyl-sn-glycerol-3-phosphate acyltransferase [Bacillota bacterium]